ncbi:class I SAM-dependent methyltransferase [Sphaerisporangium dianthi]|uniref:Class I SAM-dependent methyltransferase n=1 Tax=Sphaerisporangium dianthi TaxID=1436120 RepID=A0ABV9CCB2_9ACTN
MDELSRFQRPRFARMYERTSAESERRGTAGHRRVLLAGLSGSVVEVGAGNGMNFGHYPPEVAEVVAVEPEDILRGLAESAARRAPIPIRVVAGHADALPAPDARFDAAVVSLVLCSVPDQRRGLAELRRVLKPGGELRFFEHVRSAMWWRALVQDAVSPLWSRMAGGCHLNRDTAEAIRRAGFQIDRLDEVVYSPDRGLPAMRHILGSARAGAAPPPATRAARRRGRGSRGTGGSGPAARW